MATTGFSFGVAPSAATSAQQTSAPIPTLFGQPTPTLFGQPLVSLPTTTTSTPAHPPPPFSSRPAFGLFGASLPSDIPAPVQGKKAPKDLTATQHELFNKEKYSDLTIKCKQREWKCHRAILCPRCPFFEAACAGPFMEASTREIDLSDDDDAALGLMLKYLYTYEIFGTFLPMETVYQLIIIGDKYELEEIHDVGVQNFSRKISQLTSEDGDWAAKWYPQICQLQQKGKDVLKTQLANVIAKNAQQMIKNNAVRELIASDGELAVLLVEKLATLAPNIPTFSGVKVTSQAVN